MPRGFSLDRLREKLPLGWALWDQAMASGANFVTAIILARALGAEEFGRFVLAWFAVYFVQNIQIALVTAPIKTFAVRFTGRRRAPYLAAVFAQQIVLSIVAACVVAVIALASAGLVPTWRLDLLALPLALLVAFSQVPEFFRMVGYVQDRTGLSAVLSTLRYASQVIVLLAMTLAFPEAQSVSLALWLMFAATLLPAMVGLAVYRLPLAGWRMIRRVLWQHWVFARWLVASLALVIGRENFVSVAVGSWLGLAEVGILRAAEQLVMLVNVPLQGLGNLINVRASRAFMEGGAAGLLSFLKIVVTALMLPLAVVLFVIGLFGDWALTTVYGAEYAGHGAVVALYAAAMMLELGKACFVYAAWAMHRTRVEFIATAAGAIASAALTIPLIAMFGITGAVLAQIIFVGIAILGFLPLASDFFGRPAPGVAASDPLRPPAQGPTVRPGAAS
ncbi:MAG: hypothetical protein AAGJ53_01745 [Pseudomonadota bacterium]